MKRKIIISSGFILVLFFIAYKFCISFLFCQPNRVSGLLIPNLDSLKTIPYDQPNFFVVDTTIEKFEFQKESIESYFPPAGDQLEQGSCTAFALAYYLVSSYEKRLGEYEYGGHDDAPDYDKVFSPSFVYNSIKASDGDCESGVHFTTAFNFIKKNGVCKWSDFTYSGRENSCMAPPTKDIIQKAMAYAGYKFFKISRNVETFKSYLNSGTPIILGIWVSSNFNRNGLNASKQKPYVWNPKKNDISDYHAIMCVGYDEALKCFKLLNSYGRNWGSKGYCLVPYQTLIDRTREMYIAKLSRSGTTIQSFRNDTSMNIRPEGEIEVLENDSVDKAIDSLFREDLNLLKSIPNRSEKQNKLVQQIEKQIQSTN